MENKNTKTRIPEVLASVRHMMTEADTRFSEKSKLLEAKVRRTSFSVLEMGSATEVMAEAKRLTDDLYASYESYVRLLDTECRPYLNNGASAKEIKEVWQLIQKINKESSQICNSIAGDFGSFGSLDMRAEYYLASMEAKSIEKAWENAYAMTPEYAEERRVITETNNSKAPLVKKWKEILERVRPVREMLDKQCEPYRESLNAVLKKTPTLQQAYASAIRATYDAEKAEKEKLGFFEFSAKKALNKRIKNLEAKEKHICSNAFTQEVHKKFKDQLEGLVRQYSKKLAREYMEQDLGPFEKIKTHYYDFPVEIGIYELCYIVEAFGKMHVDDILEHSILFQKYEVDQKKILRIVRNAWDAFVIKYDDEYGQGVISPGPRKVSLEELERIIDLYDQCVDFRLKSLPVPSVSAEEFEQGIKDHIKSFVDKL